MRSVVGASALGVALTIWVVNATLFSRFFARDAGLLQQTASTEPVLVAMLPILVVVLAR